MNLKKLPKEKRNQLVLVLLITLAAVAGLGLGVIKYQYQSLDRLAEKQRIEAKKLEHAQEAMKQAQHIEAQLATARHQLTEAEADIATGDLYAWAVSTLRQFKAGYEKVEIPQFSPLSAPTAVTLLPNFPYKQATLTVVGTAYSTTWDDSLRTSRINSLTCGC